MPPELLLELEELLLDELELELLLELEELLLEELELELLLELEELLLDELELLEDELLLEELELDEPPPSGMQFGITKLLPEEWLSWNPKLADSPASKESPVAVTVVPL